MKNKLLIMSIVFVSCITNTYASNQDNIFLNLIITKNWPEIEKYYQQHKDSIHDESVLLFYKAETGKIFNRNAESIDAYQQLINKNPYNFDNQYIAGYFLQPLLQCYEEVEEYSKAADICAKLIMALRNDSNSHDVIQYYEIHGAELKKKAVGYQKIEILDLMPDNSSKVKLLKIKGQSGITFMAKWNNQTARTLFDTGCPLPSYIWNRKTAENLGVKFNLKDTLLFGSIKTVSGIIDSLFVGKYLIRNIPVNISLEEIDHNDPRQRRCDSILNSTFDIVLGLPIIKQLGCININFEKNEMDFLPVKHTLEKKRNMYIDGNRIPCLDMKVAGDNFIGQFDTGGFSSTLDINSLFYTKNSSRIRKLIKNSKQGSFIGGCSSKYLENKENYICKKIDIQIGEKKIRLKNDCTVSKSKENDDILSHPEGGGMGNGIFKYCKSAIFDFYNMNFTIF